MSASLAELAGILSERRNPRSMQIDTMDTLGILDCINTEDQTVPLAIAKVLPDIGVVVDTVVTQLQQGGRLFYIGAGTSGRLGILDAVECRPTFSVGDELVQGLIAGGEQALTSAVEGAEDNHAAGADDLKAKAITAHDVVLGIAASGRTPYVLGALQYARSLGCPAFALSCNPNGAINQLADHAIAVAVGPECLTGSTRMKAGTAQKLVLNMLSTAVMIRLGKTYENLMVDVNASNDKLRVRAKQIVIEATGCNEQEAEQALTNSSYSAKTAILMLLKSVTAEEATNLLNKHAGFLRHALQDEG